jgi:hypothetical protein
MEKPTSPSPKILYPEWQGEYLAALLEFDPKLLRRAAPAKSPGDEAGAYLLVAITPASVLGCHNCRH